MAAMVGTDAAGCCGSHREHCGTDATSGAAVGAAAPGFEEHGCAPVAPLGAAGATATCGINDGFCGFAFGTSWAATIPCLETDADTNPTGAAAGCDGAPPGVALGGAFLGGAFLGDSNLARGRGFCVRVRAGTGGGGFFTP